MYIKTEMHEDGRSHKIISMPIPEDKRYIGYIYKPLYKYVGLCPHRFIRGTGLVCNENNEVTNILKKKRNGSIGVYRIQKYFEISPGFEITLDHGIRAAMELAKVLYAKDKKKKRIVIAE